MSLTRFFDDWSTDYDDAIERCVPRYREMLWALLYYLPDGFTPKRIVELGPGSGNLSALHAARSPAAEIHLVDLSSEMLERCRERFAKHPESAARFRYHHSSFQEASFDAGSIDLVTSSISIHHLTHDEKRAFFRRVHGWLAPDGMLVYSDQFAGMTEELYRKHVEEWSRAACEKGASDEDWKHWMDHQTDHDHHASLPDQMQWLTEAGFASVDCVWRHLLWTVLYAGKR